MGQEQLENPECNIFSRLLQYQTLSNMQRWRMTGCITIFEPQYAAFSPQPVQSKHLCKGLWWSRSISPKWIHVHLRNSSASKSTTSTQSVIKWPLHPKTLPYECSVGWSRPYTISMTHVAELHLWSVTNRACDKKVLVAPKLKQSKLLHKCF